MVHITSFFHELHDFYKDLSDRQGKHLFPHFSGKLAELLHKAFEASVSRQVLLLQKWDRSDDELEQLTTLKLPAKDLANLEAAALKVGVPEILAQAAQIEANKDKAAWRKRVGTNAEDAFVAAINGIKVELLDYPSIESDQGPLSNPDDGRDFTLRLKGCNELYSIEVKSLGCGRDSVAMSMKQGKYAKEHRDHYALCVVTREENDEVSLQQFMQTACFVRNIGDLVSPRIDAVNVGLTSLEAEETGDINIALDNKRYSINIGKKIWSAGLSFQQFIAFLQDRLPVSEGDVKEQFKKEL